jgi:hypothetical protein
MNHVAIIDRIAGQADDFLEGFKNRRDARAGVLEQLNCEYATVPQAQHEKIADGVMAVLESEGFFDDVREDDDTEHPPIDGAAEEN